MPVRFVPGLEIPRFIRFSGGASGGLISIREMGDWTARTSYGPKVNPLLLSWLLSVGLSVFFYSKRLVSTAEESPGIDVLVMSC